MDKKVENLRAPRTEAARRELWARVFGTEDGKEVLRDILEDLHVVETFPSDEGIVALRNYGLEVMYYVGILDGSNGHDYIGAITRMVH